MSRWSWYEPAPKQPVPEDGLRVQQFGQTWWGEQWIRALDRLGRAYSNRLPRGRSYARAGRVVNLAVGAGEASAGVVGTRRRPYEVRIGLKTFSKSTWEDVLKVLAGKARHTVALLRGEMPSDIGEALASKGIDLFPTSSRDIETCCSCPDWANPCKHVAALHYVVAAALDFDPFLIFALRGLDRQNLLGAIAETRGFSVVSSGQPISEIDENSQWEEPEEMDEDTFLGQDRSLTQFSFRVEPPSVDLAGLSRLGPPPPALTDLPKRLGPGVRAASRAALALAERGNGGTDDQATDDDQTVRNRVIDFIQGRPEGATMMLLRSRLPDDKETLHRVVRGMRKEKLLASSGRGGATRYRLMKANTATNTTPSTASRQDKRKKAPGRKERLTSATTPQNDISLSKTLSDRMLALLGSSREPMSLREMSRHLDDLPLSKIRQVLTQLRSQGTVVMIGNRRGARYTLNKPD